MLQQQVGNHENLLKGLSFQSSSRQWRMPMRHVSNYLRRNWEITLYDLVGMPSCLPVRPRKYSVRRKRQRALLEFARHSLVELDLTRNGSEEEALERAQLCWDDGNWVYKDVNPHRYGSDGAVKLFIGCLRGFQVLKYIRAQNEMFVEEDSVNAAGGGKVHRLVDLLPASMEMIALAKSRLSWED